MNHKEKVKLNTLQLKVSLPTRIVQLLEERESSYGTVLLEYKDFTIEIGHSEIEWVCRLKNNNWIIKENKTLKDIDELIQDFTEYLK